MDTFIDPDLIFVLIDIMAIVAGVVAVGAWFVEHRRNARRQRGRRPMIFQGK